MIYKWYPDLNKRNPLPLLCITNLHHQKAEVKLLSPRFNVWLNLLKTDGTEENCFLGRVG